jgi:GDSL-like Lipase/Acylhydrolase family
MGRLGVAVAVAIGIGGLAAQPAPGSPGAATTAIVSLGDSFISGEGGRWMGNGRGRSGTDRAAFACSPWAGCRHDPHRVYGASEDNGCHRSDVAPILSAPVAVGDAVDLACSGARVENVWRAAAGGRPLRGEPPQADQLAALAGRDDVRLVVVTVGANDVGFGGLVIACALDWARSSPADPRLCRGRAQERLEALLPAMGRGLRRALSQVRAAMVGAGYRSRDYRLIVMGYASPFPSGGWIRYPQGGWSRLTEGGCPLWDADASWAAELATPSIVAAMRAAAAGAGAEFLDLRHALDGHQLCDRRAHPSAAPAAAEWVRRLDFTQGSVRESLHPNAYGQRAIGACIGLMYGRERGDYACRATPGRSYANGMRLERLK